MRTYTQLTCEQRYQIYALLKAGHNQSEIAYLIKVHKSKISRELKRNRGLKGYRPKQAHQFALNRRKSLPNVTMYPASDNYHNRKLVRTTEYQEFNY